MKDVKDREQASDIRIMSFPRHEVKNQNNWSRRTNTIKENFVEQNNVYL